MKKLQSILLAIVFIAFSSFAFANKTKVKITAPATAKKGTEITITIDVTHSGNSSFHHTEWVYLKINGKEVKRWTYDKTSLPPSGNFQLTFKYMVAEDNISLEAEGNCNLHGTAGPDNVSVKLE
jgi:desulfoferrodoxin (superoxide reductase-like protein)